MTDVDLRRRGDSYVDAKPASTLETLASELGDVDPGTVTLLVDARPGWSVTYSLRLEGPQLDGWREACRDDPPPNSPLAVGPVDEFLWHRTILAAKCVAISKDGTTVADSDARPVTFRSADLQRLLKVPANAPAGATEAVRRFYANDFAVSAVVDRVLVDAGYGRAAREDPTVGSSSA